MIASIAESILTIDARKLNHSGIGRYIRNLLPRVIPSLDARSIELLGDERDLARYRDLDRRVSVIAAGARPHSLAEQRLALTGPLRRTNLLWVPHYNVPLPYRRKLVVTIHDLAPIDLPEALNSFAKRTVARLWFAHAVGNATAILTPSEFSKRRILEVLRPAAPVSTTPLAVDPEWPALRDAPPPYDSALPYFLFVGNIKPNKNLRVLLQALEMLGNTPHVQLLIVGKQEGFQTQDETAYTFASRLGSRVRFLGTVTDHALISLYRGAEAMVMPSLYEGFGLPLLEAMRYGCPVIASAVTSIPEVVGDAALLFDPRNPGELAGHLERALDPSTKQRLRSAGLERESKFSYDQAGRVTADVLNRAMMS